MQAVREGVQAAGAALAHAVVPGLQGADEEQHQRPAQRRQEEAQLDRRPLFGVGAAVLGLRRLPAHGILTPSLFVLIALLAEISKTNYTSVAEWDVHRACGLNEATLESICFSSSGSVQQYIHIPVCLDILLASCVNNR